MIVSNEFLKIINNSIKENKLQQVYLFSQLVTNDFDEYIISFINTINGEKFNQFSELKFKDLYLCVNESNQLITKEAIAEAMLWAFKSNLSNHHKFKILIIKNIENGTPQSLNSLLKFLENPPTHTIVIMTTNQMNKVLKTIRSRAFIINIKTNLTKINSIKDFILVYANKYNLDDHEKLNTLLKNLKSAIISSFSKPESFLYFLLKHFDKDLANFLLVFMIFIYEDLAKISNNLTTNLTILSLKDAKTINNSSKIDEIIECLKAMYKTLKTNVNFPLQKSNFLIKIEKIYGK
ncbi:DNA polymerase III [[Mycoplasma] phocae]|uniref:DNA polymerase III n=1 Tax=[Mycoplasma] phocae TaxID=142651 RepID=A0A2Z5ISK8_9BACT|nr:DNA polymerase III [[Mycoplasma] phocae]AXE60768.1 DNA polymerase III [[Mycoplasma] phocae]